MKKFVSMAMVAAMTASMVPATAFAGDDINATAKVVNAWKVTDDTAEDKDVVAGAMGEKSVPELQIKLTDVAAQGTDATTTIEFTVTMDNAFIDADAVAASLTFTNDGEDKILMAGGEAVVGTKADVEAGDAAVAILDADDEEIELMVGLTDGYVFESGDVISMDLYSTLDKSRDAFVSVTSDDIKLSNDNEDMTFVDVAGEGLTIFTKDLTKVAEEEWTALDKDIEIKSEVGDLPATLLLKVSNGFEIYLSDDYPVGGDYVLEDSSDDADLDDDEIRITGFAGDKVKIQAEDIIIEATTAKAGDIATLKVSAPDNSEYGKASMEVAQVVDYTVIMSVEEDEDLPEMYSGVNSVNFGITDDSDHFSAEVTVKEAFPGAWSMRKGFNFELPEGVYVTAVDVKEAENFLTMGADLTEAGWEEAFWDAYQEGDHKNFEFKKRVFDDVNTELAHECAEVTFELQLVADPGFVGDVDLKLTGDLVDEQEVTIAKFNTPFVAQAKQNDLKIDYRYTDIPTEIVITETEPGLWSAKNNEETWFQLDVETAAITFEDDPTVTINEESGLAIEGNEADLVRVDTDGDGTNDDQALEITISEESDDEVATITISDMQLFMDRSIPAGPYALEMTTSMGIAYASEVLFAADGADDTYRTKTVDDIYDAPMYTAMTWGTDEDNVVNDVCDFSRVVRGGDAFVNVITAGREQDDASFTTKVVVPVGESYIVAGETQINLDVPAYVSEAGYTMLPVRAVATALGISNNNVLWNAETKTVTILYGQRIITMVAGQKTINVNGSVIPASAAVEITDGRTFLPMRDLATALGVTDITWDAATKTATLNGGVQ